MMKIMIKILVLTILSPLISFASTIECQPQGDGANLIDKVRIVLNQDLRQGRVSGYFVIQSQSIYYGQTLKVGSVDRSTGKHEDTLFYDSKNSELRASDGNNDWFISIPPNRDQTALFSSKISHTRSEITDIYSQQLDCVSK